MGTSPTPSGPKPRHRVKAGRRVIHHPLALAPPPGTPVVELIPIEASRSMLIGRDPRTWTPPPGGALVPQAEPAKPYDTSNGEEDNAQPPAATPAR